MSKDWEHYIADAEDAAELACFTVATGNGHTKEEADGCDDGSVGCPNCPFSTIVPREAHNERKED